MQTTYRVPFARVGWVALLAALVLLALPGTGIAASESVGSAPIQKAGDEPLARGSGYGAPDEARRVRSLQRTLRRLGWPPGPVDGFFGPGTEAAVVRFQRAARLAADGIAGKRTSRALRLAEPRPLRVGAGYGRLGGLPRVRSLQARLRTLRLRPGPTDGRYGPRTAAAVLRLQAAAGAPLTGVVDGRTRRLLANAGRILRNAGPPKPAARPNNAGRSPQKPSQRESATRPGADASDSTSLNIPLLIVAAALAGLAGALLGRLGSPTPGTSVPLAHGIVAEGRARADSVGRFRGRVHALVLGTRGLMRRPEARYLVNDPRKAGPFWVTHRDIDKLEAQAPVGTRHPGKGHGNGNGNGNGTGNGNGHSASPNGVQVVGYATVPKAAHVLISVGAWERERVGQRTRKGLEAARAKGQRIGRPAVDDVPELKERIAAMRANGLTLQAIADRLNEEGVPTLRGGEKWRPSSVQAAVGYRRPPRRWQNGNGK